MKKNDVLSGVVDALGNNGEGILHMGGTTVFVPFVLPNEKIVFKVLKVKGGIAFGKVMEIIEKSPLRVEPKCPFFKKCGGCQLQHIGYDYQPELKARTVENCFKKIAKLSVSTEGVVPSPLPYGARNKMQLPVRCEKGKNKVGFFRENSHDVVEVDDCPLQPAWAKDVISAVKDVLSEGLSAYDEEHGTGLLRHVITREINGEFLFTFVFTKDTKEFDNRLIARLSLKFERFSIYINENNRNTNVILGKSWRLVHGKGYIVVSEFGINYPVNAASFFQVNTPVKNEIYKFVTERPSVSGAVVIDAFSGAGVMTAMLARKAKKVYGIEIIPQAVSAADELKRLNNVTNMENICAPCEDVLPDLIKKVGSEADKVVLVLDPPRSGVDAATLSSIISALPDEIIYVSCSPQTLARDVGILVGSLKVENGKIVDGNDNISRYRVADVSIYDMFPQTKHVECVTLITKK